MRWVDDFLPAHVACAIPDADHFLHASVAILAHVHRSMFCENKKGRDGQQHENERIVCILKASQGLGAFWRAAQDFVKPTAYAPQHEAPVDPGDETPEPPERFGAEQHPVEEDAKVQREPQNAQTRRFKHVQILILKRPDMQLRYHRHNEQQRGKEKLLLGPERPQKYSN